MAELCFHMGIYTVIYPMHNKVGNGAAELRADSLELIVFGVNDSVVLTYLRKEACHTLWQRLRRRQMHGLLIMQRKSMHM